MKQLACLHIPNSKLEAVILADEDPPGKTYVIIQRRHHFEPVVAVTLEEVSDVLSLYFAVRLWHIRNS